MMALHVITASTASQEFMGRYLSARTANISRDGSVFDARLLQTIFDGLTLLLKMLHCTLFILITTNNTLLEPPPNMYIECTIYNIQV